MLETLVWIVAGALALVIGTLAYIGGAAVRELWRYQRDLRVWMALLRK